MASNATSPDAAAAAAAAAVSAEIAALLPVLWDDGMVKYTNIAFLMLLVYDHALTFDQEVERIWALPWRLPKFLFMVNRYVVPPMLFFGGILPSATDLTTGVCSFDAKWTSWPTILALATVEMMLILRVVALYNHNKIVRGFLVTAFILQIAAFVALAVMIMNGTSGSPGGDVFSGCLFSAPVYFWAAWLPPVCFESIIVVMTFYKVLQYDSQVSNALNVYARDSLIYFMSMFSILLSNLLLAKFGTGFMGALLIAPSSVVACIAAARMTMNMRRLAMSSKEKNRTPPPGHDRLDIDHPPQVATFSTVPDTPTQLNTAQSDSTWKPSWMEDSDLKDGLDYMDSPVHLERLGKESA